MPTSAEVTQCPVPSVCTIRGHTICVTELPSSSVQRYFLFPKNIITFFSNLDIQHLCGNSLFVSFLEFSLKHVSNIILCVHFLYSVLYSHMCKFFHVFLILPLSDMCFVSEMLLISGNSCAVFIASV